MGGVAVGSWHHTATFAFADNPDLYSNGNTGFFVSAWYNIFSFMNENGQMNGFARYGNAKDKLNLVQESYAAGLGVNFSGNKLLPEMIGAGITRVNLNPYMIEGVENIAHHESVIEFTMKKNLHPNISLQPDIQYVINIGGEKGKNAVVGILRFVASF
jgi:porin